MAIFTNQATLSYNGITVNSNVVTGEVTEAVRITKTALSDTYTPEGTVTYVVSLVNTGNGQFNGLILTDDLGAYEFGATTLVPLDYVEGSVNYYVNGVLQNTPVVTSGTELVISGISLPPASNALIIYQATANGFASPAEGGTITNTATLSGDELVGPVSDSETITADTLAQLRITKSLSPNVVTDNSPLTYTFVVENFSNTAVTAQDNAQITDAFDPILSNITVTLNGVTLTEGADYTYNESTGVFATVPGRITVPAATVTQDAQTGEFIITPGSVTLVVNGTV